MRARDQLAAEAEARGGAEAAWARTKAKLETAISEGNDALAITEAELVRAPEAELVPPRPLG